MPTDPAQTAQVQGPVVAANQSSVAEKAPRLHAEARERSHAGATMSNAVHHLNRQTERGKHDPALNWNTAQETP